MNFKWTTFNGREVMLDTIDHQHLSNIFWYYKILGYNVMKDLPKELIITLNTRFNGQLLPYRPHIQFTTEIEYLQANGMLKKTSKDGESQNYDIWFEGQLIGEIRVPFWVAKLG